MAQAQNNLNKQGTILVELSDERLAAVEEAKRTGQEFQSIGSKGAEIVDRDAMVEATREWSKDVYGSDETRMPDYLADLKRGVDDEHALNQQKAAAHNEVSDEIVSTQNEAAVSDAEKLRKDPKFFVKKIAQLNQKLAADYVKTTSQFVEQRARDDDGIEQEIRKIRVESVNDPNPATSLGKLAKDKPTDISESDAAETLEQKDRIIYGEDAYQEQAKAPRTMANKAKGRAESDNVTAEPERNEETTRKQKAEFPATAQAGKDAAAANRADAQAKREERAEAKAERKAEKSDKE